MKIVRRMGLWLCSSVFALSVSIILLYTVLSTTLLDSHAVKGWLTKSNTYSQLANNVIAPAVKSSYASQGQNNSLITPDMIQAASQASVSPDFVKKAAESNIDTFYAWINSTDATSTSPQFALPLQDAQTAFYASLENQILAKVSVLPVCTSGQQAVDISGQVHCLPRGISPQEFVSQLVNGFKENSSIFTKPVTSNDFTGSQPTLSDVATPSQATPANTVNNAMPSYVHWVHSIYPITWAAAAVLAIALVFLASSRWRGIVNVGWHIFSPAILFAIVGLLAVIFGPKLSFASLITGTQSGLVDLLQSLLRTVIVAVGTQVLLVGGSAIAIALILIGAGYLWRHLLLKRAAAAQPEPAVSRI